MQTSNNKIKGATDNLMGAATEAALAEDSNLIMEATRDTISQEVASIQAAEVKEVEALLMTGLCSWEIWASTPGRKTSQICSTRRS